MIYSVEMHGGPKDGAMMYINHLPRFWRIPSGDINAVYELRMETGDKFHYDFRSWE